MTKLNTELQSIFNYRISENGKTTIYLRIYKNIYLNTDATKLILYQPKS